MSDVVTSVIRTIVPSIVGAVASFLAAKGIDVDAEAVAGLTSFLTALFAGIYYVVARLLEKRYPKAGYLLGATKQPTYK